RWRWGSGGWPGPLGPAGAALPLPLASQSQSAQHQLGRFRVTATASPNPHQQGTLPPAVAAALAVAPGKRTEAQQTQLRAYYRANVAPALKPLADRLARRRRGRQDVEKQIPTTRVMQEMPQPRDTYLLMRGEYDKKGEKVTAGVPAALPPLPQDAPANRLGLARWLVDPSHPLTARVAVNRISQLFFGTAPAKTQAGFGAQA